MSHRRSIFSIWLAMLAACGGGTVPLPQLSTSTAGDTAGLVQRGEYLVRNVSVCGHCHAADPRDPDGPLAGGLAFRNWRLGTIYAANLTPDRETGIGAWSEAELVRAIRNGQDREGHLLAPVMPYEWLSSLSDRDALAIAAYLKSQPPVTRRLRNRPDLVFAVARALILRPARTEANPPPARRRRADRRRSTGGIWPTAWASARTATPRAAGCSRRRTSTSSTREMPRPPAPSPPTPRT